MLDCHRMAESKSPTGLRETLKQTFSTKISKEKKAEGDDATPNQNTKPAPPDTPSMLCSLLNNVRQ